MITLIGISTSRLIVMIQVVRLKSVKVTVENRINVKTAAGTRKNYLPPV